MTENNSENDNNFDENQDDKSHQDNKKNISFVKHSLTYGLVGFIIVALIMYFNHCNNRISVIGKMAGNGQFKYDSLVLIDDDNVLAIGGGCGDKHAEIYNISSNSFKEISSPNYTHQIRRNVLKLNDNTILIVSTDGAEFYNYQNKKFVKLENSVFNKILFDNDFNNKNFVNYKLFNIKPNLILCIKNYKNQKDNIEKKANLYLIDFSQNEILYNFEISNTNFDITFFKRNSENGFILKTTGSKYYSFDIEKNTYKLLEEIPEYIEKENKIEEEIIRISTKLVPLRKGYIHEPILLKNGNILFLSETHNYLFNIKVNKLEKINNFEYWRRNFSTINLPNGNVLIVGGSCGNNESHYPYNEVEMFK